MKKFSFFFKIVFLFLMLSGFVFDILRDYHEEVAVWHLILEASFLFVVTGVFVKTIQEYSMQKKSLRALLQKQTTLEHDVLQWEQQTRKLRHDLQDAIKEQFSRWNLSPAEQRVAFLILRGFSFHQMADFLNRSERTVRKQAGLIYKKAGFRSRHDFAGFFLEEIFSIEEDQGESVGSQMTH